MSYSAPTREYRFILDHLVGFDRVRALRGDDMLEPETVAAILDEAGILSANVLAPLRRAGDEDPARLENGIIRTPEGYAEAYRALADGGWIGMGADPEFGGMGLPMSITVAVHEMMSAGCVALELNPLLTQGQIHALELHADPALKALYLPKLASGEWSGTMNLTEPQAGSDLGALRTRAVPRGDGSYGITGQKIFITWGDSDLTENVCHLVLARLPDAADGTAGISLFMVPKILPDTEGLPGARNAVRVVSLEHKLGIHASPTAVMEFDDATGWLVGREGGGLPAMFTMMNDARLYCGVQGVGIAEGAFQHALVYAMDRKQGTTGGPTGTIVEHPDVRRMLVGMHARTQAARAICFACALAIDMEKLTGEAGWAARAAFLTPIAKAYGTQTGVDVANEGIQVFGGMGFIEESGAAQFLRDARIGPIYEGTNGIQAMDLTARKMKDGGETAFSILDEIEGLAEEARALMPELAGKLWDAAENLRDATEWMVSQGDWTERFAGAHPYLHAFATVLGAHYHLKAALAEGGQGDRTALARSFILRQLPGHRSLLEEAVLGSEDLFRVTPAAMTA